MAWAGETFANQNGLVHPLVRGKDGLLAHRSQMAVLEAGFLDGVEDASSVVGTAFQQPGGKRVDLLRPEGAVEVLARFVDLHLSLLGFVAGLLERPTDAYRGGAEDG